ncbi:MAG: 4Fe-4S dicluster domain-containing protein, partial [Firmicutes bacterium]|nr:4Fe-4S dicluster domain-containing protein [Bacillota bacterium]
SYADGYINGLREYMMCTTLRRVRSNAGLCVRCGRCESHCPQHIDIRDQLDRVKRRLETPVYRIAAAVAPKIMKY